MRLLLAHVREQVGLGLRLGLGEEGSERHLHPVLGWCYTLEFLCNNEDTPGVVSTTGFGSPLKNCGHCILSLTTKFIPAVVLHSLHTCFKTYVRIYALLVFNV